MPRPTRLLLQSLIPGWIFALSLIFFSIDFVIQSESPVAGWEINGPGEFVTFAVAIAVATGIPVGFFLREMYVWGEIRGIGFTRHHPADRGWLIIRDIAKDFDLETITGERPRVLQDADGSYYVGRQPHPDEVDGASGECATSQSGGEGPLAEPGPVRHLTASHLRHVYVRQRRRRSGFQTLLDKIIQHPDEDYVRTWNENVARAVWTATLRGRTDAGYLESLAASFDDMVKLLGSAKVAVVCAYVLWLGAAVEIAVTGRFDILMLCVALLFCGMTFVATVMFTHGSRRYVDELTSLQRSVVVESFSTVVVSSAGESQSAQPEQPQTQRRQAQI